VRTLNLGILAHVDAGKTTLTERLLYAAGVIDAPGSVDDGSTQTDFLALERQRGITIKAAVVSFVVDDVTVNLIDTPGHPDFIAEVERALSVLDGAVLVVSAVEGVQAQTRVLMRALQRLRVPTLIFVNKLDRGGAHPERVLHAIAERLTPAIVPMGSARDLGTRAAAFTPYGPADAAFAASLADALADHDDALMAAYVADERSVSYCHLRDALAAQTRRALVHPVFFGSAITGAGVDALTAGIVEMLPTAEGDAEGPVSGAVFKVERGPAGEKIAYARMFSGTVRTRDRLRFGRDDEAKVTAIAVFERGSAVRRQSVSAGQIARLWGLGDIRIGDAIGAPRASLEVHHFAPPTLEAAIVPRRHADKGALHGALAQLAEQDPLIDLRQDDVRQELYVSLYGEVQKEVIQATLAAEFGVEVEFRETTTICVERPVGVGAAVELLGKDGNPFPATVGLRVEPAGIGSGFEFRLDVELTSIPLYVYGAVEEFRHAIEDAVRDALRQGLCGWQVTDCLVTMTHSDYRSPGTGSGHFRKLVPLVLMSALKQAGTAVCQPIHHFHLELPADALGAVLSALSRLDAVPEAPSLRSSSCALEGTIPAARVHELQQQLSSLTRGEGVLESTFGRYEPLGGPPPTRPRTDLNPLDRKEYLLHLLRRV
jgi:ribosomal protection tetracycline resistance protein